MIKSIKELKEFIIWAKKQGIKDIKIGDNAFSISDYELAKNVVNEATYGVSHTPEANKEPSNRIEHIKNQAELDAEKREEEELKFWSST
jgi:hypothetical protein